MSLFQSLEFSAATHPGLKRDNNEDTFLNAPSAGLWLIADGMGGHEAGEVASAIVRDTIENLAQQQPELFSLSNAIQVAHQAILTSAENGIGAVGMGSTVVALFNQHKNYQIAWVGDSRAYLWTASRNGGNLARLTVDHSYVQMLFATGSISADEVESHPDKNIITQCLGMQEITHVSVGITQGQWQKDQWILLCSDGLTDELNDKTIAKILTENHDSVTAIDQLLHEALTHGGHDNITLQIIESPIQQQNTLFTNIGNWLPKVDQISNAERFFYLLTIISLVVLLYVIVI
jgi:PPM family protein phosphatase